MQVTESALKKMRDLAKKATSNNLTAEERKALNNEIKKQQDLLDKAAERANVNGKKLLDGKYNESLQTGATKQFSTSVKIGDMSSKGVGVDKIDLSDVNKAKDALAKIDNALQNVNKERKQVDAVRTKMQETAAIQSKVVESLTGNGGSQNTQSIQMLLEQSKSQINFYNPTSVQNIIKMSANSAQSLLMSKVGGAS
jgi:flagellin